MTYREDEDFAARLAVARQRLSERREAEDLERREKLAAEKAEEARLIAGYVLWACEISVPGFLFPILCFVSSCMFAIGWRIHHGRKS